MTSALVAPHPQTIAAPTFYPHQPSTPVPREVRIDPALITLLNTCNAKSLDDTTLSSFLNDIEEDQTVIPLLALGLRQDVRRYYTSPADLREEVLSDLRTSFSIIKLIKGNVAFFEKETQDLIGRFL